MVGEGAGYTDAGIRGQSRFRSGVVGGGQIGMGTRPGLVATRPGDRVSMKSVVIEEGIALYHTFPKLYMMGGQICSVDSLDRAWKF